MKLAFYNEFHAPYDPESLLTAPLGGTESSIAELCLALSKDHQVVLYNNSPDIQPFGNMTVANISVFPKPYFDWFIFGAWINEDVLNSFTKFQKVAFWTHLDPSYNVANSLAKKEVLDRLDLILTVSDWQRNAYIEKFNIAPEKIRTIGNPYCLRAMPSYQAKDYSIPKLIYTSVPYRGLSILSYAFPMFRKTFPDATLKVITGMELYGMNDNAQFKYLLNRLSKMDNVTLLKPMGKVELYRHLEESNMFVFPTHINETFCLSALEAELSYNMLCLTRTGALSEIFPNAEFFPPAVLTAESWNNFMLDCWNNRNVVKKASDNKFKYSPANVAKRLVHELTT